MAPIVMCHCSPRAFSHCCCQVYAPTLLGSANWAGTLDTAMQGYLSKLEQGLGSIVRRGDDATGADGRKSEEDTYANIHEPAVRGGVACAPW